MNDAQSSGSANFTRAIEIMTDEDEDEATPLVKELLELEPGIVHERDENGWTLLHHAVRNYQFTLVPLLLACGADANAISHNDQSPLGLCAGSEEGEETCRRLLLAKGARRTPREEVFYMIRDGRDDEVIERFKADAALMNAGHPTLGSYVHVAAQYGKNPKVLEYLLNQGLDPDIRRDGAETPLHIAYRNPAAVRILIEHGANINARDDEGYTPLHYAVGHDRDETATLLVESGAELNLKTNDGETVLDFVHEMQYPGHRELARYLKSKGAKPGKSVP